MDTPKDWRTDEQRANDIAQARELREQASKSGLRFEAYLPLDIAEWVLDLVERGVFTTPGEAVFVCMQEAMELAPHADLREELFRRQIDAAINDPRPGIPAAEVKARLEEKHRAPRPKPATWVKQDYGGLGARK